jgi:hypothetical protein
LATPDLAASVGVDRPSAGLLTGDFVGVMGVTTFAPENEKDWTGVVVEEDVVNGAGVEMTGVVVMGVVMGRVEGEESVGEGTIGVAVIVEVTWVMGLVEEEELWRGEERLLLLRLWLLIKLSCVVGVSGEEMAMGLERDGYWMKEPEGTLLTTGAKEVLYV